jgi:hypothetical protein
MKHRQTIHTFEAQELQSKINKSKHERARKILQSKLLTTYMESYVDLENKTAIVLLFNPGPDRKTYYKTLYLTDDNIRCYNENVADFIMREYQISPDNIHVYSFSELKKALANGELKEFPKSSISRPATESEPENDTELPVIMVSDEDNNTGQKSLAQSSQEIKQEAETMFDLRDSNLVKLGMIDSGNNTNEDWEAGNIVIFTEVVMSGVK